MIGRALKLIRSYYGVSQLELSSSLGLSNSHISEIESEKKQPSLDVLRKYSEYFDIPLSSILFFSENLDSAKPSEKLRLSLAKSIVSLLEWNEERNAAKERRKVKSKA